MWQQMEDKSVLEWGKQAATMLPYWARNIIEAVLFTGQVPFLSPNQQCQSTEGAELN